MEAILSVLGELTVWLMLFGFILFMAWMMILSKPEWYIFEDYDDDEERDQTTGSDPG